MPPALEPGASGNSVSGAVDVWIDPSGAVAEAWPDTCAPGTEEASVAAAKNFGFTPATLDGPPLPSTSRLVFKFKLGG